jgi:hypothetical protein
MTEPDPTDAPSAPAQGSKAWHFVKGGLLPPPVFLGLGALGIVMLNARGDAPLGLFFLGLVGALVGFGVLVSRRWATARPFALGLLLSTVLWGLILGLFGVLVVAAAGAGSRG